MHGPGVDPVRNGASVAREPGGIAAVFILQWLEGLALAEVMRVTAYGYPLALIVHATGMAILIGAVLVVNLRLLGLVRAIPPESLPPILRLAIFGFVINLVSGLLLFIADPLHYVSNVPFLVKMLCITFGLVIAVLMHRTPGFRNAAAQGEAAASLTGRPRQLALLSLLSWTAALIAGRLIAYL